MTKHTSSKPATNRDNSLLLFRKGWNAAAKKVDLSRYEFIEHVNVMLDGNVFPTLANRFLNDTTHSKIRWRMPATYDCADPRKCHSSYQITTTCHGTYTIYDSGKINRPGRKTPTTGVRSFIKVTSWAKRRSNLRHTWYATIGIKNSVLSCRRNNPVNIRESSNTHNSELFPATVVQTTHQCNPVVHKAGAVILPGGRTPQEFINTIMKLDSSHVVDNTAVQSPQ